MAFVQGRRNAYIITGDPDGGKDVEHEAFSCGHCQGVVKLPHGAKLGEKLADGSGLGEFCLCCMNPICVGCNETMNRTRRCVPFQQRLDIAASRRDMFKAMGLEGTA